MRKYNPKESIFRGNPQTGIAWEEWFIGKFDAKRPSITLNTPADFIWKDEAIDLKVCELYKRPNKRGKPVDPAKQAGNWVFNRNKVKPGVDAFICIGLLDGKVKKAFKIPAVDFPRTGATIGAGNSRYDRYLIEL